MTNAFLEALTHIIDPQYIITSDQDKELYLTDWRKRYSGKALTIVLPRTSTEVAKIVQLCAANGVSIVPQGGAYGLLWRRYP